MSEIAKQLFDSLRNAKDAIRDVAPGLKDLVPEIKSEFARMGGLGASELAAALFKGDPFVMYGPNQRAAKVEQEHSLFGPQTPTPERESPEHENTLER